MASISIAPVPFGQRAAEQMAQRIAEDNKGIVAEDKANSRIPNSSIGFVTERRKNGSTRGSGLDQGGGVD
jgi:hypothetical protein